jgi:hypothetical protein
MKKDVTEAENRPKLHLSNCFFRAVIFQNVENIRKVKF